VSSRGEVIKLKKGVLNVHMFHELCIPQTNPKIEKKRVCYILNTKSMKNQSFRVKEFCTT